MNFLKEMLQKIKKIQGATLYSRAFYLLVMLAACTVVLVFFGIIFALIHGSLPAFKAFGYHFLYSSRWDPVLSQFGASGAIEGTLITSFIALMITIPVSFGITVFNLKIAPQWSRRYIRIAIDLLAGIPSLVYGMWGLFFLAPVIGTYIQPKLQAWFGGSSMVGIFFSGPNIGVGLFTAGVVLAIMVIPYVASIMHDIFGLVPDMLQESAYALGANTWETIMKIIVPYGLIGFFGGIMLGLGRALGETMAVAFVIGNAHTMTTTLFSPATSITASLANEFTESTSGIYSAALIELGLCLFVVTAIVIFLSRLLLFFVAKQHSNTLGT